MAGERRRTRSPAPRRAERLRIGAAFVLGAIAVLFAVLNLDEVEVNWLVAEWSTPLIVVIAASLLLGLAIGWVTRARR